MSRLQFYNEAKRQFQELGIPLPKKWNESGSTTEYWRNQVNENNTTIAGIIKRRQQRRTRTIEEELQNKITNRLISKNDFQRIINRAINQNITIDNNQAQRLWNNIQGLNTGDTIRPASGNTFNPNKRFPKSTGSYNYLSGDFDFVRTDENNIKSF